MTVPEQHVTPQVAQVRAFGQECLQKAAACREKGWPPEYEDAYLSTAADISGASDLELMESGIQFPQ